MTNVIELAKQAGLLVIGTADGCDAVYTWPHGITSELERFAKLVGNAKLEEAKQKCRSYPEWAHWGQTDNYVIANKGAQDCAEAIESLKEPTP